MQRTFIEDPVTERRIDVAVMGNTDTLVFIEVNRPIALWIAEHQRRGTRMQVETEWIDGVRLVSFDVDPLDAWIAPENNVALLIDGEVAAIGLLTAMTGKTASMWMPADVAETLTRVYSSDQTAVRLAQIDAFDEGTATILLTGSEPVTVPVDSLPSVLASRP